MPNTKPCVFLVAESQLLRETLVKFLNKKSVLNVGGASPIVPGISSIIASSGADVLILDSTSARHSNGEVLRQIVSNVPNINVVLIDMDDDPEIRLEFLRAGALAYLPKDVSAADVVSTVLAVSRGHAVCAAHRVYLDPFRSNLTAFDV